MPCRKYSELWLFLIILSASYICTRSSELDDFESMVLSEWEKSKTYQMPIDNSAFFSDELPSTVIDVGNFDFIVVGAGSSGAIVARRLSDHGWKVLLLEAGKEENDFTLIPSATLPSWFSDYNWGYYTTEQKFTCQANPNKQCFYPRGKALGGSSTINGMVYNRGNPLDWDYWSDFGATKWTFKDVLPFFKLLENYQNIYGDLGYHGYRGPVTIDHGRPPNYLIQVFLQAFDETGDLTRDYNGEIFMGAGQGHYNIKDGRRASTGSCYLEDPGRNLVILTQAFVYKVVVNSSKVAKGVEFVRKGKRFKAGSRIEVIVSAGVVNTPQLLMLSGIGPAEELSQHGITLVQDLPVGQQFEDHAYIELHFETNFTMFDVNKSYKEYIWEYFNQVGVMSSPGSFAFGFISANNNKPDYPDIEVFMRINPPLFVNAETLTKMEHSFMIGAILLHAKSRGSIKLQSSDPKYFPLIDPNSLSEPNDVETMVEAIEYILKLQDTKAFQEYDIKLMDRTLPICKDWRYLSKEYWACQIKQVGIPALHGVGSCAMGTNGVVDSEFKVHGVERLRVIDASIVPRSPSGHTNAIAMVLGERGADFIIKSYRKV